MTVAGWTSTAALCVLLLGGAMPCAASLAASAASCLPRTSNACTTPITVPNKPTNGALLPSVPRYASRRSSF